MPRGGAEALADVADNYTRCYFALDGTHRLVAKVYFGLESIKDRTKLYAGLGLGHFDWIPSDFTGDKLEVIGMAYDRLLNTAQSIAQQNV